MSNKLLVVEDAVGLVLRESRTFLFGFLVLSSLISIFYLFLLPSLPDGTFTLFAVRFITPVQILFSFVFGILLSLVITLNAFAFQIHASSAKKMSIGAVLASLVNGLCCTPVIPSLIALTGVSTPVLFEYVPPIEAFFENYYPYFYLISAGLMFLSLHYLSKNIICCARRL